MDVDKNPLKAYMGSTVKSLEVGEATQNRVCVQSKSEYCSQCLDLEDKLKAAKYRCAALELEIEGEKNEAKVLQRKLVALEAEKIAIKNVAKLLKRKNTKPKALKTRIQNVKQNIMPEAIEGDDKVLCLMIENKVLECEKRKAETDLEMWKGKCEEMHSLITELEKKLVSKDAHSGSRNGTLCSARLDGLQAVEKVTNLDGTIHPKTGMETSRAASKHENAKKDADRVKKRITFEKEGLTNKNIAPSTPAGVKSAVSSFINIHDNDEDNDDLIGPNSSVQCISTPKRKRAFNAVESDSDSDDDNLPLNRLEIKRSEEQPKHYYPKKDSMKSTDSEVEVKDSGNRRRLVKKKNCEEKGDKVKRCSSFQNSYNRVSVSGDDDDVGVDESDNDRESLDSFIVDDDDDDDSNGDGVTDSGDGSNNNGVSGASDSSFDQENASDNETYAEIMDRIRRKKTHKSEWEYEADMLSAFEDDPELYLKAVCVLYRMQTDDERYDKCTVYRNERGFSQCDAYRGCNLGEFLTGKQSEGDLIKSVKELQQHDSEGLEKCRSLAQRYSKQLFAIYKNREDPFFRPSS